MLSCKCISETLFTILMLQLTAAAGQQRAFFTVKTGDGVTLPCRNKGQEKLNCDRITWTFSQPGNRTVSWFEQGDFTEEANAKSGRLSVTADCSLVMKNVRVEDCGEYYCRQIPTTSPNLYMKVDLFVVTMNEQRNNGKVTFTCSVSKDTVCKHPVVWLYEGKEKISPDVNVSGSCSAAVTIPASHLHQDSKFYELLKCKVQDAYDKKDLLFTFSHQSSGWIWWVVIVSMLLAGLLTVMVTIGWMKTKGSKKQKEDQPEVDAYVSYASMNLAMGTRTKSNVPDAVIYSTLQAPSAVI
ncbi:PREDICTED: uncharacterized protein LOC106905214 isoform X4 [Poecilia mexicana]|uniref:uncharacterized protein LOC106905214 isoform X4 n=1 Tax=Poecilia mexicana TaxID=48701 RepID=UPI00072E5C7D|nr:PREDICTED: uncharacterized protein LOC106905214 isoform X4 [Poecilia mexicana]